MKFKKLLIGAGLGLLILTNGAEVTGYSDT